MTPLRLRYDSAMLFVIPLNIVFVHDLGGSAVGTWIATETNSFWPPWLSRVKGLEHARIMTLGYDSSWNTCMRKMKACVRRCSVCKEASLVCEEQFCAV